MTHQIIFFGGFIWRKHSEQIGFLQHVDTLRFPG